MSIPVQRLGRFWRIFDYSELDAQIDKFRKLAQAYKQDNAAYYGEYLSRVLFGE